MTDTPRITMDAIAVEPRLMGLKYHIVTYG